mgnify:FL=1
MKFLLFIISHLNSIRYYNWPVAIALITSTSVFHKPLPAETIEKLQGKHMAHTKPRATSGGWWGIPFYTKKVLMKKTFEILFIFSAFSLI